jgi:GTPase SAR1 family protein
MIRTKRGIPKFILVGNKVDKVDQREVSTDEGAMLARSYNCPFFETSAKTRHNVDAAFTGIVRALRESTKEVVPANASGKPQGGKVGKKGWKERLGCVIL